MRNDDHIIFENYKNKSSKLHFGMSEGEYNKMEEEREKSEHKQFKKDYNKAVKSGHLKHAKSEDDEQERRWEKRQLEIAAKVCAKELQAGKHLMEIIDDVTDEYGLDPKDLALTLYNNGVIDDSELHEFETYVSSTPGEDAQRKASPSQFSGQPVKPVGNFANSPVKPGYDAMQNTINQKLAAKKGKSEDDETSPAGWLTEYIGAFKRAFADVEGIGYSGDSISDEQFNTAADQLIGSEWGDEAPKAKEALIYLLKGFYGIGIQDS